MNVSIRSLLPTAAPAKFRQRLVTAASSGTPVNLTTVSLSSLSHIAGIATATAGAAHGFEAGDDVVIAGATPAEFNGHFTIDSVPSSTTFTYRVPSDIAPSASGTLTAVGQLWFRRAQCIGNKAIRTANSGTVYLGIAATNDTQPLSIATGAERIIEPVSGARMNLADFWLDVATNDDGVLILWH